MSGYLMHKPLWLVLGQGMVERFLRITPRQPKPDCFDWNPYHIDWINLWLSLFYLRKLFIYFYNLFLKRFELCFKVTNLTSCRHLRTVATEGLRTKSTPSLTQAQSKYHSIISTINQPLGCFIGFVEERPFRSYGTPRHWTRSLERFSQSISNLS